VGGKHSHHCTIPAPEKKAPRKHLVHAITIIGVQLYSWCATLLSGQSTELLFYVLLQLVLPPWPMYRKHALDWQKPRPEKTDTKREGGKKKQK